MIEVEAKVRLRHGERKHVKRILTKIARFKRKTVKKDEYYGQFKKQSVRLRTENLPTCPPHSYGRRAGQAGKKTKLNIKTKTRDCGIELNQEFEIPVTCAGAMRKFLKKYSIRCFAKKVKHSEIYMRDDVIFELNRIHGLGDFLEIEILVDSKKKTPAAQKKLIRLFKRFGFGKERFEHKYYIELLKGKR